MPLTEEPELLELIEQAKIKRVFAQYAKCLDEFDFEGVAQTFWEDGVMDHGPGRGGPTKGRAAMVKGLTERNVNTTRFVHQLGQSIIDVKGDYAEAETYVLGCVQNREGSVAHVYLRYFDKLRKVDDVWKMTYRKSAAMLAENSNEAQWNWISLHPSKI